MKYNRALYEKMSQMCKDAGVPDMFSDEEIAKQRVNDIASYHNANGKYPSSKDKDPNVRRLGRWLLNMRAAKKRSEMIMVPIKSKEV
jgi:hypothetical protein